MTASSQPANRPHIYTRGSLSSTRNLRDVHGTNREVEIYDVLFSAELSIREILQCWPSIDSRRYYVTTRTAPASISGVSGKNKLAAVLQMVQIQLMTNIGCRASPKSSLDFSEASDVKKTASGRGWREWSLVWRPYSRVRSDWFAAETQAQSPANT